MTDKSVYIHVVTYNNSESILKCIESVLKQKNFETGKNLFFHISDNASSDQTVSLLDSIAAKGVIVQKNSQNFGFSAAHNIAFKNFIDSECDYFLCLNPDLSLKDDAVSSLISAIESDTSIGAVCPKLLRADAQLNPLVPAIIDAAGMYITSGLRHFDRGSNMPDGPEFSKKTFVFGGSGACLLMKREYIQNVAISQPEYRKNLELVYPQLKNAPENRVEVFDEAFFAYREDADLAWRSQLMGWKCLYVPEAVGYHIRKVTPEKRNVLTDDINLLGVKNRFLLQLNNYSLSYGIRTFISGYFFRNILVIIAVIFKERSSLPAFSQILKLFKRALNRRQILRSKMRVPHAEVSKWFTVQTEECI